MATKEDHSNSCEHCFIIISNNIPLLFCLLSKTQYNDHHLQLRSLVLLCEAIFFQLFTEQMYQANAEYPISQIDVPPKHPQNPNTIKVCQRNPKNFHNRTWTTVTHMHEIYKLKKYQKSIGKNTNEWERWLQLWKTHLTYLRILLWGSSS